jgi:hypothetical protein
MYPFWYVVLFQWKFFINYILFLKGSILRSCRFSRQAEMQGKRNFVNKLIHASAANHYDSDRPGMNCGCTTVQSKILEVQDWKINVPNKIFLLYSILKIQDCTCLLSTMLPKDTIGHYSKPAESRSCPHNLFLKTVFAILFPSTSKFPILSLLTLPNQNSILVYHLSFTCQCLTQFTNHDLTVAIQASYLWKVLCY